VWRTVTTILPPWSRRRPLNIAHRGARAFAPENTVDAIVKAKRANADMVELDVQLSSDGIPVVFHDDALTRRTDVRTRFPERAPWLVSQFTAAEMTSLDAGSWFAAELHGAAAQRSETYLQDLFVEERCEFVSAVDLARYESGNVPVPTLRDALECAKALDLLVNIEIKNIPRRYPGIAAAVVEVVRSIDMVSRVLVSSFDHTQIRDVLACDDAFATAVLTSDRLASPAMYVRDLCGAVALHAGCSGHSDSLGLDSLSGSVDASMIRSLREAGLFVVAWTENDPARMRALLESGVSGIVTDYPNRLSRVLNDPSTNTNRRFVG
jgi:glycerophosphoryl diester phosphodiesterase